MEASERAAAAAELARRLVDELERRDREYLEKGGLVRVKLLLVDAGGDRQIVALGPPAWKLEPRNEKGELLFLEQLQLVGVGGRARACRAPA